MISVRIGVKQLNDLGNGLSITDVDVWSIPNRQIISNPLALQDGAINTYSKFQPKIITINGWINRDGKRELEDAIDDIKRRMYANEAPVSIGFDRGTRTWTCTLIEALFDRMHQPDHCDFSLKFWSGNPFAYGDEESLTSVRLGNASSPWVFYNNNKQGTTTASAVPRFTFTIDHFVAGTDANTNPVYLEFGNPITREFIRLNASPNREKYVNLSANQIYTIDFEKRQVFRGTTQGGSRVETSGVWADWNGSLDDFSLEVNGNSQAVWGITISGSFTHRYI